MRSAQYCRPAGSSGFKTHWRSTTSPRPSRTLLSCGAVAPTIVMRTPPVQRSRSRWRNRAWASTANKRAVYTRVPACRITGSSTSLMACSRSIATRRPTRRHRTAGGTSRSRRCRRRRWSRRWSFRPHRFPSPRSCRSDLMTASLDGRVAIVTGAAKGMGAEICVALAREGAHLALAARDVAPLEKLSGEIEKLGRRALVEPTDVTDEAAVQRLVERTKSTLGGRIDILVNAAGVTGPIETPVWEIKTEDWDQVLAANVKGTFLPIKHVLPTMIAQRYGKIVNISGTSGLRGYKLRAAYSSSKWALRGLTRTVALEVGPYNVNVNAVHPGIVDGPRMDRLCREEHDGVGDVARGRVPRLRRLAEHDRPVDHRRRGMGYMNSEGGFAPL